MNAYRLPCGARTRWAIVGRGSEPRGAGPLQRGRLRGIDIHSRILRWREDTVLREVEVIREMEDASWEYLWSNLEGVTDEELDWKPHPEANHIRWIVGHLTWFEEWAADALAETGRYLKDHHPLAFEDSLDEMRARFSAARDRYRDAAEALTRADLDRRISYLKKYDVSILNLLQTHARHLAGHRYQVRYVRGCYSRAHGTDKAAFDPW